MYFTKGNLEIPNQPLLNNETQLDPSGSPCLSSPVPAHGQEHRRTQDTFYRGSCLGASINYVEEHGGTPCQHTKKAPIINLSTKQECGKKILKILPTQFMDALLGKRPHQVEFRVPFFLEGQTLSELRSRSTYQLTPNPGGRGYCTSHRSAAFRQMLDLKKKIIKRNQKR